MPHLAINQANTAAILALFAVSPTGYLYAPTTVQFVILSSAGTQVWPASGRLSGTLVDVGVYSAGFTPNAAGLGAGQDYVIKWFYTSSDGDSELEWPLSFGVVSAGLAMPYWSYINPQRLRDEGLTSAKMSDARLIQMIKTCQQYIERRCRQPFRPIRYTQKMGGVTGHTLFFSIPIVGIESVSLYTSVIDQGTFAVFFIPTHNTDPGWLPEDNRANPKIRLAEEPGLFSGGTTLQRYGSVPLGAKNITVKGVWGCLEPDGSTPDAIQTAMLYMIMANANKLPAGEATTSASGVIIRERTDRHEVEFAAPAAGSVMTAAPFVKSTEAEELLRIWRGPILIDAPRDWMQETSRDEGW